MCVSYCSCLHVAALPFQAKYIVWFFFCHVLPMTVCYFNNKLPKNKTFKLYNWFIKFSYCTNIIFKAAETFRTLGDRKFYLFHLYGCYYKTLINDLWGKLHTFRNIRLSSVWLLSIGIVTLWGRPLIKPRTTGGGINLWPSMKYGD